MSQTGETDLNVTTVTQTVEDSASRGITDPTTLRHAIQQQRDLVLRLDLFVDLRREVVDHDVEGLREAVRNRDGAIAQLDHLVSAYEDLTAWV